MPGAAQELPLRRTELGGIESDQIHAVVEGDQLDDVAGTDRDLARDEPDFAFAARQVDSVNRDIVVDPKLGPKRRVARRERGR